MKFFFYIGLFLFLSSTHANFKFEKYSINEVLQSKKDAVDFEFNFINISKNKVSITDISTSCGCTIAKPDKYSYRYNEKGIIKGTFNIGNRVGLQEKQIIISTDNLGQPKIILTISVYIPRIISITPSVLFWRVGDSIELKTSKIEVEKSSNYKIKDIVSDSDFFNLTYKKIDAYNVLVSIIPLETVQSVRSKTKIILENENGDEKIYNLHMLIK